MRPEEIAALGELAGDAARATAEQVHTVHDGIAQRVWKAIGPVSLPVRLAHDVIARGAYSAAGEVSRVVVRAGAGVVGRAAPRDAGSIEDSAAGRAVVGALNGAFGDSLHQRGNRLALPMTLRHDAHDLVMSRDALAQAYPAATPRLAVFLHGLARTDDAWTLRRPPQGTYGERLRAELGYTPLYIRYNTGRHISENGRELASLLSLLSSAWPVEVQEIALLGHSVGGLVAQSACHYGAESLWVGKVRHVFTLGSPHGGSPLERLTGSAVSLLAKLPETRAFAKALNARSSGIKDLGRGWLLDEEWLAGDARALPPGGSRRVPFLPGAEHYFISAPARLRLGVGQQVDLLSHPGVYDQIHGRLSRGRELPAPPRALPAPSGESQRP
jgi:hypothetical protein